MENTHNEKLRMNEIARRMAAFHMLHTTGAFCKENVEFRNDDNNN